VRHSDHRLVQGETHADAVAGTHAKRDVRKRVPLSFLFRSETVDRYACYLFDECYLCGP
jgi:hypothetical protein